MVDQWWAYRYDADEATSAFFVGLYLASRRLTRVPVADLDLHRALRAIWTGGAFPPGGAARDLLAHVSRPRG